MQANCLILHFFHTQTVLFCKFFTPKLSYFALFSLANCLILQVIGTQMGFCIFVYIFNGHY